MSLLIAACAPLASYPDGGVRQVPSPNFDASRLATGKTPLAVELKLLKAVPENFKQDAHHWLILHGRYVCKARKPECWRCTIVDLCEFKEKSSGP